MGQNQNCSEAEQNPSDIAQNCGQLRLVRWRVAHWLHALESNLRLLEAEVGCMSRIKCVCEILLRLWKEAGYPDLGECPNTSGIPPFSFGLMRFPPENVVVDSYAMTPNRY